MGFEGPVLEVAERVAYRFVVVDNSRSMMKRDHCLVPEGFKGVKT